jgi:hypothetical protein
MIGRIRHIRGLRGAHLLKRDVPEGVEFVTILWFDSLDSVREFAGEEYEVAVVPDEARRLLSRFDARSAHYETVLALVATEGRGRFDQFSPPGTLSSRRNGSFQGKSWAYRQIRSVRGGFAAGFLKHSAQRGSFAKSCRRKPSSIVSRNGDAAISAIVFSRTLPSFCVPS